MHGISRSPHFPARKILPAFGMGLICGLFAGNAGAQMPVTDVAAIVSQRTNSALSLAKQVEEYTQLVQTHTQLVQQYQQILMTVRGLGTNFSITPNRLQRIDDPSSMIDQNCPGPSNGSLLGRLVSSLASSASPSQPIAISQQIICAQIVSVQIDSYNKTVDMLTKLNQYGGALQQLNQLANQVSTLGMTSGATTQATIYSATVAQSINEWQISVKGNEDIIDALSQQQAFLATRAFRGSNTILGNVIQAAALESAFSY